MRLVKKSRTFVKTIFDSVSLVPGCEFWDPSPFECKFSACIKMHSQFTWPCLHIQVIIDSFIVFFDFIVCYDIKIYSYFKLFDTDFQRYGKKGSFFFSVSCMPVQFKKESKSIFGLNGKIT